MKVKLITGMAAALMAGWFSANISAQQLLDPLLVYEPATENQFMPGGRAAGMGGAQIAAGDDGSALWYNPALLTRIRNIELSGTLSHQRFVNSTNYRGYASSEARVNNTSFGGLWAMYPVPTEQGGLTLGFSVNRVRSFDRIFRYFNGSFIFPETGGEDENGSLWAWSFGGGIEISPKASVGLSVDILDGTDDYSNFASYRDPVDGPIEYSLNITDEYAGISGKIGGVYQASNSLSLGAVIGLPTSISIEQQSSEFLDSAGVRYEDYDGASYRYTLPFWFGMGAMLSFADLSIAGDISYVDYTQLRYKSGFADLSRANLTAMEYYNDAVNLHVGVEYLVRTADLRLRAGYFRQPSPFNWFPVNTQPHYFTLGAGILIDRTINLDLALLAGSFEREDRDINTIEEYDTQRFLMTVSYRIK